MKAIFVNILAIVIVVGGYFYFSKKTQDLNDNKFNVELTSLNTSPNLQQNLQNYIGKPLVINFWASWCTACDNEKEFLKQIYSAHGSHVQIIGISTSDEYNKAKSSDKINYMKYPVYFDAKNKIAKRFGISSLPQTIVLDSNGIRKLHYKKALTKKTFAELNEKIMHADHLPPLKSNKTYAIAYRPDGHKKPITNFQLTSQDGNTFDSTTLKNKVWLTNFIFTSCTTMCPKLTKQAHSLQEKYKDLSLVSISVDPKNDTPSALKAYAQKYKADTKRWHFLRGDLNKVKKLMNNNFKVAAEDNPNLHTDHFVLIDSQKKIHGYYSSSNDEDMAKLTKDVGYLIRTRRVQ